MEILHSKIIGDGVPLIILHGFLGMSDNWKTLGNKYAEVGFEVHLVDQRNHGRSFQSHEFDYDFMVNDLKNYLDHHNINSAILLGHSMGGKTAMYFACNYPERTIKLIVADISPKYYPPHHQWIIDALNKLNFDEIKSRGQADEVLKPLITDFGIRQFLLKNLYRVDKEKLGWRFNLEVLQFKIEEIGEPIHPMAIFTGQSLFLRGDRSEYIMPSDYGEIKKHFTNAFIETVTNAGHWLHAENPSEFYQKSIGFIKQEQS